MTTVYAETYVINGRTYGIENHEQPGNQYKRFKVWSGGCGIFETDDIDEARKILHHHAAAHVLAEYHGHNERAAAAWRAKVDLGNDPFNLGAFRCFPR